MPLKNMGNCIHPSSSAAATAQERAKPEAAIAPDERTTESSSNATSSPRASPEPAPRADAIVAGERRDEGPGNAAGFQPATSSSPQTPSDDIAPSAVERTREEGQSRLRDLVASGARAGDIDWKSVISLAEDLHRREQRLLRSHSARRFGNGAASGSNASRSQAFFERRRRRRELSRRRKLESVGSFSVNLHIYEEDDVRRSLHSSLAEHDELRERAAAGPGGRIDLIGGVDRSPLRRGISRTTTSPDRTTVETETPGPPSPLVQSRPATGSFMEAVSLFDSAKSDECSSNSSSDSSTSSSPAPEENWDLKTIDENATVTDW